MGLYIAEEMTDETIDTAGKKKETGVATPIGCQAHYCVKRNAINNLTNA